MLMLILIMVMTMMIIVMIIVMKSADKAAKHDRKLKSPNNKRMKQKCAMKMMNKDVKNVK